MLGLLSIGIALTFGVLERLGTWAAWSCRDDVDSRSSPGEQSLTDDHIIGALAVLALGLLGASRCLGHHHWWNAQPIVKKYLVLR